jgi:hypothetical protein
VPQRQNRSCPIRYYPAISSHHAATSGGMRYWYRSPLGFPEPRSENVKGQTLDPFTLLEYLEIRARLPRRLSNVKSEPLNSRGTSLA